MASLTWEQALAEARTQINAAANQQYISALNTVTTKNWFWSSPTTVAGANALVAYWFALAARLGYPSLLTSARTFYTTASQSTVPDVRVAQIQGVLSRAVGLLDAAGGLRDRRLAGVYRAFGEIAKADRVEAAQWRALEQSGIGIAAGTVKGTVVDVAKIGEKVGRVITDKKPPGTPDWLWFLQRNVWFVVGGVVVLGAAYFYLRPVLAPLTRVRDAAARATSRAATKAEAKLDRLATNPRRRRSRR